MTTEQTTDTASTAPTAPTTGAPAPDLSPTPWVRQQLEQILETGDTSAAQVQNRPVVVLTTTGAKSGRERLVPLMRVERDGVYAAVASQGGAPKHPLWYHNLLAHPDLTLQDGTTTIDVRARLADEAERADWWPACVAAFPPYADYQTKTDRVIPVFLLEPR